MDRGGQVGDRDGPPAPPPPECAAGPHQQGVRVPAGKCPATFDSAVIPSAQPASATWEDRLLDPAFVMNQYLLRFCLESAPPDAPLYRVSDGAPHSVHAELDAAGGAPCVLFVGSYT